MDEDWISADRAYKLVASVSAGSPADAICSRAFDGLVFARAKRLVMGAKVLDNVGIPPEFWWARGAAALEKNWVAGDFETWIDDRVHCRAYGVEFKRTDIDAIVPPSQDQPSVRPMGAGQLCERCQMPERGTKDARM